MTSTDLMLITAAVGAAFSAVCALLAAFADWPRQARHVADPHPRPGADTPTPSAPWRTNPLPDTRPCTYVDMPPLVVDSPPSARGVLPAPAGIPIERLWVCGLCHDGREVVGATCIWCGAHPVMQP